jgi:hypothetical protein
MDNQTQPEAAGRQPFIDRRAELSQPATPASEALTHGQQGLLLAALAIGILLMGIQLWLLTVALDLYLGAGDHPVWPLPLVSGLIFLGGLFTLRLLNRRRRPQA